MKLLIFTLGAIAFAANAEWLLNPDAETLWAENGISIRTDPASGFKRSWYSNPGDPKHVEIAPAADGKGFTFSGKNASTYTTVPLSKDYPYLVLRISKVENMPGYVNWTLLTQPFSYKISQVTTPEPGLFVLNLFANNPLPDGMKSMNLTFYTYNVKMTFSEMKLVKHPDYSVDAASEKAVLSPGDRIRFTVRLKEEAEDVSLRFYTAGVPRAVKLNGVEKLQLKPEDSEQRIWSAEIALESFGAKGFQKNDILMKASVLGGELEEPVWNTFPYGWNPGK